MVSARILVTGASSYLARSLVPIVSKKSRVYGIARRGKVVQPASAVNFDLTCVDRIGSLMDKVRPDAIIHTAAVNPGGDDASMDAINHRASAALADAASVRDIRFVMVSTDCVHSGQDAPYADHAVADPISPYGRTKAAGEQAVLACNRQAAVVRTSLIYSLNTMDRGTAGFCERLQRGQHLDLFDDVFRQPVWADSLSHALCELALHHTDISGTLNVVGAQRMSRAEFGVAMLEYWGVDIASKVALCSGAAHRGVAMDLTSTCECADALNLARPGVSEVLRMRHR